MIAGVIDRIVDNKHAVILFEDKKKEYVMSVEQLPEGCQEGSWLLIELQDEVIKHIQLDEQKTEKKQVLIKNKMDMLRARSIGSRFKRN